MIESESPSAVPAEVDDGGYIVPRHGHGRLRPFRPGEAPNPKGKGGRYHGVVRIAREASPQAMKVLVQIMADENEETRARIVAIQEILGRAHGRIPAEMKDDGTPVIDASKMSEAQLTLLIEALKLAQAAKPTPQADPEEA